MRLPEPMPAACTKFRIVWLGRRDTVEVLPLEGHRLPRSNPGQSTANPGEDRSTVLIALQRSGYHEHSAAEFPQHYGAAAFHFGRGGRVDVKGPLHARCAASAGLCRFADRSWHPVWHPERNDSAEMLAMQSLAFACGGTWLRQRSFVGGAIATAAR